ncbi:MAG: uracil-DNA glycosylase family protein [Pseudomonadota bacterium]
MTLAALSDEISACRICEERFAATETHHTPRPVAWLSEAPILICGQAPGARVHASGIPFDDPSGDRLRDWLGVDRAAFYDRAQFAILPMAFCFPGYDAKGSDLPPPKVCAKTWHARAMAAMPAVELLLLVGGYAQSWHLGAKGVTATVRAWRDHAPGAVPLPHPSWRNTAWLKKNAWFEAELVPWLRGRVREVLA